MNTYCEKMRVPKTRANNPKSKKKTLEEVLFIQIVHTQLKHTHSHTQASFLT